MIVLLVRTLEVYLALGALFALGFVSFGVQRVDPDARGAGVGFRLLVLPGSLLLWPYLAVRWARGTPPPGECTAHKRAAQHVTEGQR